MKGKIIKGIAGFYYVQAEDGKQYTCKAKGIFRNVNLKPLVGDNVMIHMSDDHISESIITEILPRTNVLMRPAVANIDQAMIIFAAAEPNPNLNLLDRFLISMEIQNIETIICFNKIDKVLEDELNLLNKIYENSGCKMLFSSVKSEINMDKIKSALKNKTTVFAGPSGVGKSSIINYLHPDANMEVGSISDKIKRGKHTTRHAELICIDHNSFIMDTPGFSSLHFNLSDANKLKSYFREFVKYEDQCKFIGCSHINEPECAIKEAIEEGHIHRNRYKNYLSMYIEMEATKKY